MERLYLRNLF